MIGSSVVPGLPKICVTPSACSSSTKAARPLIWLDCTLSDMRVAELHGGRDEMAGPEGRCCHVELAGERGPAHAERRAWTSPVRTNARSTPQNSWVAVKSG